MTPPASTGSGHSPVHIGVLVSKDTAGQGWGEPPPDPAPGDRWAGHSWGQGDSEVPVLHAGRARGQRGMGTGAPGILASPGDGTRATFPSVMLGDEEEKDEACGICLLKSPASPS